MRQQLRHQAWIALAAASIFFVNLGGPHLWDADEACYASCAREMFERGDWVVPVFNGEWSFEKPPLMFWCMMSGYEWFGVTEFAARFWSAIFGIGTALLTYHLGRLLFRAEVGFWAGLITASSIIFTISARAATVDSALVFLTTATMLAFVVGISGNRAASCLPQSETGDGPRLAMSASPWRSWIAFVVMYACVGCAVLAKGPVGLVLPVAMIGLYLAIVNSLASSQSQTSASAEGWISRFRAIMRPFGFGNLVRSAWQMRPLTGIAVVLAVAAPWCIWVSLQTDGLWLAQFLGKNNFQRALVAFEAHSGPIFYYIPAILIGFFPWSVFLAPCIIHLVRQLREGSPSKNGYLFLTCWVSVFVGCWSLIGTKLPHYVLPAYPALALLTGCFVDRWLTEPAGLKAWWLRNAWITMIAVGLGLIVVVPFITAKILPGEAVLGLVGIIPCVGGAWCWWKASQNRHREAAIAFAVTSAAFLIATFGFAVLRVDQHQNAQDLMAAIEKDGPKTPDMITYRFRRESFIYYAGHKIPHCPNATHLTEQLLSNEAPYIITDDHGEKDIIATYGDRFSLLARHPKFLKQGDVVVFAPQKAQRAAQTAEGQLHEVQR